MVLSYCSLAVLGLYFAAVKATNTSGDPTDISNWPSCAVSSLADNPFSKSQDWLKSSNSKHAYPRAFPVRPIAECSRTSLASARILPLPSQLQGAKLVCAVMQSERVSRQSLTLPPGSGESHCCNCCLTPDIVDIRTLSIALCAPVGGQGPTVSASVASYFATRTHLPSTVTSVSGVSASFATATPSPSPNPANILSYPTCAVSSSSHLRAGIMTMPC